MQVSVLPARSLTPGQLAAWSEITRASPSLAGPFFAPEFTLAAAATRDDVEVAVLVEGSTPVGFFPFQRGPGGAGVPVASRMSDFHGLVVRPGIAWDASALVQACGLRSWRFEDLLAEQEPFARFHWATNPSPFLDLSGGFEEYRRRRRAQGSRGVEWMLSKERKAARHAGSVRFELHVDDDEVFAQLLRWKSGQYRETGLPDPTASPWVVRFLDHVRRLRSPALRGLLSALYLGDRLAAVHLLVTTPTVWHSWMPAYDRELAAARPGSVCLLALIQAAADAGAARFDLGRGDEPYKSVLATGSTALAQGSVDLRPFAAAIGRSWFRARNWVSRTPLRRPLLGPARWVRRRYAARRPE